jgi:hypothetical protein
MDLSPLHHFLEGQHGVEVVAFNAERSCPVMIMSHSRSASGTNISPRLTQISPENSSKPGCKYTLVSIPDGLSHAEESEGARIGVRKRETNECDRTSGDIRMGGCG